MSADLGMFGAPIGQYRAAEEADTRAATALKLGQLAQLPVRARLMNAEAGKFEQDVAQEKQLGELWKQLNAPAPNVGGMAATASRPVTNMADQFDTLATAALGAGMVTKAEKLVETAATLRQKAASTGASVAAGELSKLKLISQGAQQQGQIWGGATDQTSWDNANALYEFQTGRPSPYRDVPYSPALVKQINDAALTTQQRYKAAQEQASADALKDYRAQRLKQLDAQNQIRKQKLDLERDRENRLEKNGGKEAGTPQTAEVQQARALITKAFGDNISPEEAKDAAFSVAAQAKVLRKQNPALSAAMAIQQAYNSARANGDFSESEKKVMGYSIPGTKKVFYGLGKTVDNPIVVEATTEISKIPEGRYVKNARGQVGIRTKTGVKLISPAIIGQ